MMTPGKETGHLMSHWIWAGSAQYIIVMTPGQGLVISLCQRRVRAGWICVGQIVSMVYNKIKKEGKYWSSVNCKRNTKRHNNNKYAQDVHLIVPHCLHLNADPVGPAAYPEPCLRMIEVPDGFCKPVIVNGRAVEECGIGTRVEYILYTLFLTYDEKTRYSTGNGKRDKIKLYFVN